VAIARAVCEALRDAVPSVAVGAIVRVPDGQRVVTALSREASSVVLQIDPSGDGPPRRMFPALADEWIVPLGGPADSSSGRGSLHVADALAGRDGPRSALLADLVERGALVLAAGLAGADALSSQRDDTAHVRALQARVIQGEKLASVGQIAAKVVHELNNPLTAIVTYASYLTRKLDRSGLDPADVERLRRIGESADRILRFSRELTADARPDEESAGLVAMAEVVDRAVVFCEHLVSGSGIHVAVRHDPAVPPTVGLRGQLTQVFVNLLTNACHALQDAGKAEDGLVEIHSTLTEDGRVQVSVADNGQGVSPENVVRIFDPFFTTKAAGRGTGLGLSIVRSIVEQHGGRVWVRSIVGSGTTFVVELPVRRT
jgi:signal transduction histidine kinase